MVGSTVKFSLRNDVRPLTDAVGVSSAARARSHRSALWRAARPKVLYLCVAPQKPPIAEKKQKHALSKREWRRQPTT